jgi:hypothetical protein
MFPFWQRQPIVIPGIDCSLQMFVSYTILFMPNLDKGNRYIANLVALVITHGSDLQLDWVQWQISTW